MSETIINFIQSYLSGFVSSFLVLLAVYLVFWKLFAKKFATSKVQLVKRAGWDQIKTEILNSFWTTLSGTVISVTVLSLYAGGNVRFYTDINMYGGVWYIIFSFVFLLFFWDAWFYFFHRLMHHPKIYKYIHAVHHQSLDVNPFTVSSFHVIESAILGFWIIPVAFVVPIYVPMLGVLQFIGLANNIKSHLGYEIYPLWFQKTWLKYLISSTHHNIHHTRYNGNYGLMFTFWDTFLGTDFRDTDQVFVQIKNRKAVSIQDNTKYLPVQISRIEKETDDTCSVYFENLPKEFYNYQAGQYINIRVKVNGKNYDRIFSLSSSPEDNFLRITTKLNGPVTHHLFYDATPGETVGLMYPCGEFCVYPNSQNSKNYLMIAGGSGITPLYSMIKTLLKQEPNSKIKLLYANRDSNSVIFKKDLESLVSSFPNLQLFHYISSQKRLDKQSVAQALSFGSDSDIVDNFESTNQKNTALQITNIQNFKLNDFGLKKSDLEIPQSQKSQNYKNQTGDNQVDKRQNLEVECFICGPKSLKVAMIDNLKELGVADKNIHTEEFVEGYTAWLPRLKFASKISG